MVYYLQDKYISLLTDFGFKRVFGTEPNKALLIDFLNTLLPEHHHIQDLTFKNNENLGQTPIDRKARHDATIRAYNLLNELGYYFYQNKAMHEQADRLATSLTDKKLAKQLEDFATDLKKYNATLTTLDGDFYVASEENLREELSKSYFKIVSYPGKPSQGSLEKLKYFEGEVSGKVKAKFEAYVLTLKKLNEALVQTQKPPLSIKTFEQFMQEK